MKSVIGTCILLLFAQGCNSLMSQDLPKPNIKSDERIVFFTTDARFNDDDDTWIVPIHAWVHELDKANVRRVAISTTLNVKYGLKATPQTKANFDRRIRLIVADNERGKHVVVTIAGTTVALPETEPNGHTRAEIKLDADAVKKHASDGILSFTANLGKGDKRVFRGTSQLIPPEGISVISDFDDTVKVTHATDRGKMLDHSLFRDYRAIPGMPELYASWADRGVAFHYVSSSPWHLYEPIDEFMNKSGFPGRSLQLKHFRFKDTSLLNLFKKGTETKPPQIFAILNAYPEREFILVGDSGQHDPEVYADVYKRFPKQIARIYIHNVNGAGRGDKRFSEVFEGVDSDVWQLFDDPAKLQLPD